MEGGFMHNTHGLSDSDHPTVVNLAERLTASKGNQLQMVESIFHYVREEIKFGFPPTWDEVKASETIYYGLGYCNTKATLFVALCRAVGIPARVHFGLIDLQIMHGILPTFVFPLMPKLGGHS
jgi:transglutaminase-like putative cysteine protease